MGLLQAVIHLIAVKVSVVLKHTEGALQMKVQFLELAVASENIPHDLCESQRPAPHLSSPAPQNMGALEAVPGVRRLESSSTLSCCSVLRGWVYAAFSPASRSLCCC